MAYKLIWEPNGLLVQRYGTYSISNILLAINEIYGDARFDDIHYRIVDLSEVNEITVSFGDVDVAVDHEVNPLKSNPNIKLAFVSTDKLIQKLFAEYKRVGNYVPGKIELFPTLKAARAWAYPRQLCESPI